MPEPASESESLTFHWHKPARKARGLTFWLFVVLLGLAAFFYLFQVVYPQAQRFTPVPHHIIALNPGDPAAREFLNKVQDRDFLILPTSNETGAAASLDDHAPVFHPTFEGHKLQLQDLPQKAFSVPSARLLQTDAPVLPPLDLSELQTPPQAAKPAANAAKLTMRLTGPLAGRGLLQAPDLGGVILNDPASCRFQLGVNADGSVAVALPLASAETQESMQKLGTAMREMRFVPAEPKAETPMWGMATFEWSKTAP
jgi:hypothetical protein